MKLNSRKWAKFAIRWGIAVFGITYVLLKTSFHDHVTVLDKSLSPQQVRIEDGTPNTAREFWAFYGGHRQYPIPRGDVWSPPGDQRTVEIHNVAGKDVKAKVLAVHPQLDQQAKQPPAELLVEDPTN